MQYTVAFLLLLACILALTACGPAPTGAPTAAPTSPSASPAPTAPPARPTVPRQTSPGAPASAVSQLSADERAFAFDFYRAVREQKGNLFLSPYSISQALAMTFAGARGNTEKQMAQALRYSLPQNQLHPAFNALDLALSGKAQDKERFQLSIANSLWGQAGYQFRPEFLDTLGEHYGAGLRQVDFIEERNREQARQTINQWVSDQTQNKIKDLIPQGALTGDSRLVLANAIYFNAKWQVTFEGGTRNGPFSLQSGETITVPFMTRRTATDYAEGAGFQAVDIKYKEERMRMTILLPAPGQFESFESSLNAERVNTILQSLKMQDLQLTLPKFKYETTLEQVVKALTQMGMPDAFAPNAADFSGMDGTRKLYISNILHKAYVAVNELGTEAAAATGVVVGVTSMPTVMVVNRPFIFFIRDAESGAVLFVGRVVDPR